MMTASDVLWVLDVLAAAGVRPWLDGGWGVDALVGHETRKHDDLDLVIDSRDVGAALCALAGHGFVLFRDERPTAFVLRDPTDRRVDVHSIEMTPQGGIQHQPDGSGFLYDAAGLCGTGHVAGRSVRCLSVALQLRCHSGYELDADDLHDIALLRVLAVR
jgi:lincosamide nucleotidyltransferase A/C/D/E